MGQLHFGQEAEHFRKDFNCESWYKNNDISLWHCRGCHKLMPISCQDSQLKSVSFWMALLGPATSGFRLCVGAQAKGVPQADGSTRVERWARGIIRAREFRRVSNRSTHR